MMEWNKNDNVATLLQPLPDSSAVMGNRELWQVWVGYLVSKMVVVDKDTQQNAWLFYELFFLHSIIAVSGSKLFKDHLCLRLQFSATYF